jgi:hypothetical protein
MCEIAYEMTMLLSMPQHMQELADSIPSLRRTSTESSLLTSLVATVLLKLESALGHLGEHVCQDVPAGQIIRA